MSSMRPPMLAGPMPRQTKRFSIGSADQLIGVGVGVGVGVGLRAGAGLCEGAGLGDDAGFCACVAIAPSAIDPNARAQIRTRSQP